MSNPFFLAMQQLIQERNVSFSLLGRAEVLCNTWGRIQSKSLSVLQTISNMISQRVATFDLPSTLEEHGVDLAHLVFKQTEAMENSIKNMHAVLEMFEKVKNDWNRLESEAARHVAKSLSIQSSPAVKKPQPLSTESMIQITSVTPVQVHGIISKLAYMYKEEFSYKSMLLTTLSLNMSNFDQIQNLIDRWTIESRIDDRVEQELSERIKLYKVVKKVLESVD